MIGALPVMAGSIRFNRCCRRVSSLEERRTVSSLGRYSRVRWTGLVGG
jgi:hypothetical protein